MQGSSLPQQRILDLVQGSLPQLPEKLRVWAQRHLIEPRVVAVSLDPEGNRSGEVWLVTDDVGVEDSSCRIVYDLVSKAFGLECRMANQVSWYMGPIGTFDEAVNSL